MPGAGKPPLAMPAVEASTWHRVPGYSSDDSESEDEEEANMLKTAGERLKDILAILGTNWIDRPLIKFVPPVKDRHFLPISSLPPASKRWGHNPPPTFRLESNVASIVRDTFLASGLFPTRDKDFVVQWSGPGMRDGSYEALNEFQHVNHFPGSSELTRKDRLWSHFNDMAKTFGHDAFDFVPKTYVLPKDVDEFLKAYENTNQLWIVKPSASSRGRGIFVLQDLDDLPLEEAVVSRYVENPLLIQGLKFDLRVYVLVTSFEPLRAYVYREGLTRFASKPYSTKKEHMGDAYRHLTNYSINKSASNFVENQELGADNVGHKWSLSALNRHLKCIGVDVKLMWARIMDLLIKSLLSVKPVIVSRTQNLTFERENCFEIYGFDVLVDEDLKPWLLEVNLSPSMAADSPLDWQIKSSLLVDSFNLIGMAHVDRQTNSLSRMRVQRDNLYRSQRSSTVSGRSSSAGPGRLPPRPGSRAGASARSSSASLRAASPVADGMAKLLEGMGEEVAATPNPVGSSGIPERALVLDSLGDEQLKMLTRSVQEIGRSRNFVRMYPTQAAVRRYAPVLRALGRRREEGAGGLGGAGGLSASQTLAALLFGKKPVQSRSRSMPMLPSGRLSASSSPTRASSSRSRELVEQPAEAEDSPTEVQQRRGVSNQASPTAHAAARAASTMGREAERLVMLEYLHRICKVCGGLPSRGRLHLAQSAAFARLFTFKRRVQQQLVGVGMQDTLSVDEGDPVEELISACTDGIHRLERDIWEEVGEEYPGPGSDSSDEANDSDDADDVRPSWLAARLPALVADGPVCRRVLRALPELSVADLESALHGTEGSSDFRKLFEPFTRGRHDPVLPLSEILTASQARPPSPPPRRRLPGCASSLGSSAPPRMEPATSAARHYSPLRPSRSTPILPELGRSSPAPQRPPLLGGSAARLEGLYPVPQDFRPLASTAPSAAPGYLATKPPPLLAKPPPLPRKTVHPSVYHRDIEL